MHLHPIQPSTFNILFPSATFDTSITTGRPYDGRRSPTWVSQTVRQGTPIQPSTFNILFPSTTSDTFITTGRPYDVRQSPTWVSQTGRQGTPIQPSTFNIQHFISLYYL